MRGIEVLTFLKLQHPALNHRRMASQEHFQLGLTTGHNVLTVFKLYNRVSRVEPKDLVKEELK